MLLEEFEQRTGFFPPIGLYEEIEKRYSAESIDKDEFCKRYKENTDGLAESIQREVTLKEIKKDQEIRKAQKQKDEQIEQMKKQIEDLRERLERAEGWEPYECSVMPQKDYEELSRATAIRMSIKSAAEWIEAEFGFKREEIIVHTNIPEYQRSEVGMIRQHGIRERLPIYVATDWNYIKFDVKGLSYEVVNGELYKYCD